MTLEGLLALLILSQDMWCPPLSFLFCFRSHFYPVKQSFKQQWNAASTPRHKLHLVQSSGRTVPGMVDRNLLGFKLIPTTWLMRWRGWINKTPSMFVRGERQSVPSMNRHWAPVVLQQPWPGRFMLPITAQRGSGADRGGGQLEDSSLACQLHPD